MNRTPEFGTGEDDEGATDEELDSGRERRPRPWLVPLIVAAVVGVAVGVIISQRGNSAGPSRSAASSSPIEPVIPTFSGTVVPVPEPSIRLDPPGLCPSNVFCRTTPTSVDAQRAARSAVDDAFGPPSLLRFVARSLRDGSLYSRVLTANVPGGKLEIVLCRCTDDAATAREPDIAGGATILVATGAVADLHVSATVGLYGHRAEGSNEPDRELQRLVHDERLAVGT